MSKGLQGFLEIIEADPDRGNVVERFLQLAVEMPDGMEKVDALLRLALSLKTHASEEAIELVRQVYEQRDATWVTDLVDFEIRVMEVLREIFVATEHPAKAEVLALEIKKAKETAPARRRSAEALFKQKTEITQVSVMPQPAAPQKPRAPVQLSPPMPALPKAALKPKQKPTREKGAPSQPPVDAARAVAAGSPLEDLPLKDVKKLFQLFDQYFKKPVEALPPEPQIAPRHEFEDKRWQESFWTPLQAYLLGDAPKNEASLKERLMFLRRAQAWTVSESRLAQIAARLARTNDLREELALSLWLDLGLGITQRVLTTTRLDAFLLSFWSFTMDRMMAEGRHRQALALARSTLTETLGDSWAREAFKRLIAIWSEMELEGFAWKESDGMRVLVENLKVRERPYLTRLLA